jgi:hypothetical protein
MMAAPPNIAPLNYTVNVTGDCSNNSSGIISVSVSGGTPPYSFNWQDFSPCINSTGLCEKFGVVGGNYSVRINDSSLPQNFEFIVNIPVSNGVCASIVQVQNTTCNQFNGSVTGSSTSQYSSTQFLLVDSADTLLQSATTAVQDVVFTNLSAGTYNLIALDLGGCSGRTQSFIVDNSTALDFGFYVVPNSNCGSNQTNGKLYITGLTGTAPFTYNWSVGTSTGSTLTGLTEGVYSCTVTDAYGCQASKSAQITTVSPLAFGYWSAATPTCFNSDGSLTLYITGGTAPYYYSASTGNVEVSYLQQFTLSSIPNGTYTVSVTDAGLCNTNVTTSLQSPQSIASVDISSTNSNCSSNDGSITVAISQGSTPYTYTLIKPNGDTLNTQSAQPLQVYTGLQEGTYTVFVSDATGCGTSQEVYIFTQDTFTISTSVTGTTCGANNGVVEVIRTTGGTGPYDFSLDDDQIILDTSLSAITFSNVSAGQHTVTVTDSTGCTQTQQVVVTSQPLLTFSLYSESCGTGNEGVLTAFISSGAPPFTFNWSNNVTGNPQQISVSGLSAGTYTLTIVDANACSYQRTAVISCDANFVSYQTYTMGSEVLTVQSQSQRGLLQMLNDGYQDLIQGDTNCNLISAVYTAKVSTEPGGLSNQQSFYTGTTLNIAPSDNLWYDTIKTLLLTIPGISNVVVDPINNELSISTDPNNSTIRSQKIIIELIINYDINC